MYAVMLETYDNDGNAVQPQDVWKEAEPLPVAMRLGPDEAQGAISSGSQVMLLPEAGSAKMWDFGTLCYMSLKVREHVRPRTMQELTQFVMRILRSKPSWRKRLASDITGADCAELIEETYTTLSMRRKARILLHGIFAFGVRMGACRHNPAQCIMYRDEPDPVVRVLSIEQVRSLVRAAQQEPHIACAPVVGVMLWAGLRPTEVMRLHWGDVHMREREIHLTSLNEQTGMMRCLPMHDVLHAWLKRTVRYMLPGSRMIPRGWEKRWRALRQAAGFTEWNPDILRHTFATYHMKHFQDITGLQTALGHASAQLLLSRYRRVDGVTSDGAAEFWGYEEPKRRMRQKGWS